MLSIGEGSGFSGTVIACAKNIEIGNGVRCGANTLINDTDWHSNDKRVGPDAAVKIGDNAWLGTSVIVLKGVTIGQRAMIATGSIVTRSIPENTVAAGVPARIIRTSD
jgi:acetyltransferase-like isoleucine patch superfamily enzyme